MLLSILYILAMLLLFSASIFVHELGHFLVARAFGMVATTFSIGMGKALWKYKRGGITYQIGVFPFGGFVALPQMDPNSFIEGAQPDTISDNIPSYPAISPWKKIAVSVAGAFGNIVFAFILGTLVWLLGKPSSLQEQNAIVGIVSTNSPAFALGMVPGDEIIALDDKPIANWQNIVETTALCPAREIRLRVLTRDGAGERDITLTTEKTLLGIWILPGIDGMDSCHVASVYPNSGAAAAGLQAGDHLVRYDGQKIYSRAHLKQMVPAAAGRPATIEFRRNGELHTAQIESTYDEELDRHLIGIQFNTLADLDYGELAYPTPWTQVRGHARAIFDFLGALFTPATAGTAASAVGGPVLILMMLWLMVKSSFMLAIWFTGFLNVNLAIINLLPLPILDGGHVILNLWAGITRRPVPPRFINAMVNMFAILFILLFLTLTFRDSVRHIVPSVRDWFPPPPASTPAIFDPEK